tara:strand:- start:616 stop:1482 length:867 start_codon:yes stop_codon:yes gene_type:complete
LKSKSRKGLGRGIEALFLENNENSRTDNYQKDNVKTIPIELLEVNPFQPRTFFDEEALNDLSESIKSRGILQPILVRPKPKKESGWQIIAGERRWRAAQKAGLHEIPVLIHEIEDSEVAIIALLENIQREDLSPLEEAGAFKKLIEDFGLTQEKLSKALGCSRVYITNMLRLLTLPKKIKSMLDDKLLNVGQVRALIGKKNTIEIANTIVNKQLNVRQVEDLIRSKHLKHKTKIYKDPNIIDLEKELEDFLGLKIEIKDKKGKGEIIFKYENLDQLDEIIRKVKMNSS